jgi:uncharacterized membrane protein
MASFTCEVTIERPVEEVFAFTDDLSNNPKWQTTTLEVIPQTQGPVRVGTKATEVRQFLGRRFEWSYEVTEHIPNKRSAVRFTSGPIPGGGIWSFEPIDGKTRFVWDVNMEGSGFFKLAEPVFARLAKREIESNCGHLKDLLEAAPR